MGYRELPLTSRAIIAGTILAALTLGVLASPHWIPIPAWQMAVAVAACVVLANVQIRLTEEKGRMSLGFAGCLAVILLWGPANGGLVALLEGLAGNVMPGIPLPWRRRKRVDAAKTVFNASNHAASTIMAGLCFVWTNGDAGVLSLRHSALPVMLTTVVFFLVNTLDTAAILATSRGARFLRVWYENFLWTAPQYLTTSSCVFGALLILGNDTWRWASVVVLSPMYVVYYSYRMYMGKIRGDLTHITELNDLNNSVITSLATAIDAKDHYTNTHLARVQLYGVEIAKHMKLPTDQREAIRCAALVHDVGKLGVPENLLTKPGKLTPEEHLRIQEHVEIGVAILRPVRFPWPVADVVMGHHERWDGLGYPQGLKGEEIPIGARVIAVADVYDALTSDRPYRKAMTREKACEHLLTLAGTHLDQAVVRAFLTVLPACDVKLAEIEGGQVDTVDTAYAPTGLGQDVMAQIARANSEFLALYEMSQSLPVPVDLSATLEAVLGKIQGMIPCATCAVFLKTSEDELSAEAVAGMYQHWLKGMTMKIGEGLSGRAFEELRPIVNGVATLDVGRKIPPEETVELNSALIVPIRSNGETLGTLSLYDTSYNIYTEDHRRLLGLIAEHTANSIYGAQRVHQTEALALKDPLTGMPNARALTNWLTRRLEESFRTHEPFALVLIDLDNFKAVNDTLGHLRGDRALCEVGSAMEACVRTGDLLTRYAGDEFILAVKTADYNGVSELCHRLAEAVDGMGNIEGVRIGASSGFAIFPDDGLNAAELIQIADNRMYRDKNRRKAQLRS